MFLSVLQTPAAAADGADAAVYVAVPATAFRLGRRRCKYGHENEIETETTRRVLVSKVWTLTAQLASFVSCTSFRSVVENIYLLNTHTTTTTNNNNNNE